MSDTMTPELDERQAARNGLRGSLDGANAAIVGVLIVLTIANLIENTARFKFGNLPGTVGLLAPSLLVAMASVPSILGGGGGLDVSIGPMVGLLNVVLVKDLLMNGHDNPILVIPFVLIAGTALGLLNGFVVVKLRLQPIVGTLAMYLVYAGLSPWVMRSPEGTVPGWLASFAETWSVVPILIVIGMWLAFRTIPAYGMLMSIGGSDRAAFTAGVPVAAIRIASYSLGGFIAGAAALSLSALIGSGDPNIGPNFTLKALAAVALGGVSLAGGRGGLLNAALGALVIFQLELLLTAAGASTFILRIIYGVVLVLAVVVNSFLARRNR